MNAFAKFKEANLVHNIDLDRYRSEDVRHNVKPATHYRDAMIGRLVSRAEGDPTSTPLPFNMLRNRFELRPHEMTIWAGYKGHGKSLMISQAFMAAIKRNKRVFVFSPEFRPEAVLERMLYQYSRTIEPGNQHVEAFMAFVAERMWLYDTQGSTKPDDVLALCRYAAAEIGIDHILIDSLMKCGMAPDDYGAQKAFVDKLQTIAHANPLHVHLVAHARKANNDSKPPTLHDIKGTSEIADMAENVLSVWRNKEKEKSPNQKAGEPDAILTVEAQRNGAGWIGAVNLLCDRDSMLFYEPGNNPERSEHVRL